MTPKKKILILADPIDQQKAGICTYLSQLLAKLYEQSEHEYILIRSIHDDRYTKWKNIIIPWSLPRVPGWPSIRMFFIIPIIARIHRVDAVFEPAHFGPFFLPKRIKRITAIHDLTPILFPEFHTSIGSGLQMKYLPKILSNADAIISNSDSTTRDLLAYIPQRHHHKIHTLLLGRDMYFKAVKDASVLEKHQITGQYIVTTSTIEPRKNHLTILKAFEKLVDDGDISITLVITGEYGWKYEAIKRAIEKHRYRDRIVITGYVTKEELRQLYSHATLSIYASMYEGFGLPILESLACGTRCLVAQNSSLTQVGGDVSVFFETKNHIQLANLITKYKDQPLSQDEHIRISSHLEKFSWEQYAQEFETTLSDLYRPEHTLQSSHVSEKSS